jgi:hypothetical protein
MKQKKISITGSKVLLWLPLACLAGFMAGSWGARDDLRAYQESVKEERKNAAKKTGGFDTFANLVKIPEMARRPRKKKHLAKSGVPTVKAVSSAQGTNAASSVKTPAAAGEERPSRRRFTPDDLRARIDEAQELWRTRVDVVRAQWKEKLKLSGAAETAFDEALQEMNNKLYDSVAAVAEMLAEADTMSPELGLRLMGETTAIMAETYDRIGACVPPEMRSDVSSMMIVDFVDPGVAEPLIGVQGKLEGFPRAPGRIR